MKNIYLDNNATTEPLPEVIEAVIKGCCTFGNPSSIHSFGRAAKARLIHARQTVATFLGTRPDEIIFTSSGTEALNMVLRGFFGFRPAGHIITTACEHAAVYNTIQALEAAGCSVTYIPVGSFGAATPDQVTAAIQPDTRLITLMAANNETGVRTDIEGIARIALEHGIAFVVDGVALLGKERFQIPQGVSALCCSGHKIHGPKGVGFAYVRKGLKLQPHITGGEQEGGRRSGTEDIAAISGLTTAIEILQPILSETVATQRTLRDLFEQKLHAVCPGICINGDGPRICNTSNIAFPGMEGEVLLTQLDLHGIAASHGSACASGALEPSRVLTSMGLTRARCASSLRFSLSRFTTEEEILRVVEVISQWTST